MAYKIDEYMLDYVMWRRSQELYEPFSKGFNKFQKRRDVLSSKERPDDLDYGLVPDNPIMSSSRPHIIRYLSSVETADMDSVEFELAETLRVPLLDGEDVEVDEYRISLKGEDLPSLFFCRFGRSAFFEPYGYEISETGYVISHTSLEITAKKMAGFEDASVGKSFRMGNIMSQRSCDRATAESIVKKEENLFFKFVLCESCGFEIRFDDKYCPCCGAKNAFEEFPYVVSDDRGFFSDSDYRELITLNECPHCHQLTEFDDGHYCSNCGRSVDWSYPPKVSDTNETSKHLFSILKSSGALAATGVVRQEKSIIIRTNGEVVVCGIFVGKLLDGQQVERIKAIIEAYKPILKTLKRQNYEKIHAEDTCYTLGFDENYFRVSGLERENLDSVPSRQLAHSFARSIAYEFFGEIASAFNDFNVGIKMNAVSEGYWSIYVCSPEIEDKITVGLRELEIKELEKKEKERREKEEKARKRQEQLNTQPRQQTSSINQPVVKQQPKVEEKKGLLSWLRKK